MAAAQQKMAGGTLTFKSNDGYVLTAPVEGFSVAVDDQYSSIGIDYDHGFGSIYKTAESVSFTATLKYGETYTIRDIGVDVTKTHTVKGNKVTKNYRSALGVPKDALVWYDDDSDHTFFEWTERVIVDE